MRNGRTRAQVFGNWYGTAEATLRDELAAGRELILEIDWQGAHQVRNRFPEAVGIFILPPDLATLEARLRGRGQDDAAVIAGRMAQARAEIVHHLDYDYLVINDDFEVALDDLAAIVRARRLLHPIRSPLLGPLLADLLGYRTEPPRPTFPCRRVAASGLRPWRLPGGSDAKPC